MNRSTAWTVVGLVLLLGLVAGLRLRLLDIPLERDEGDYAYFGMLMADGVSLVDDDVRIRFPLTSALFAGIIAAFGNTPAAIHLGLLLIHLVTLLVFYRLGTRLVHSGFGLAAAVLLALLLLGQSVRGLSLNREQLILAFVLPALLVLLRGIETRRAVLFFCSGLWMGLAFLIKQPAAVFILFGGLATLLAHVDPRGRRVEMSRMLKHAACYAVGVFLCYAAVCLLYASLGEFDRFWERTVSDPGARASAVPFEQGISRARAVFARLFEESTLIWILVSAGITAPLWSTTIRRRALFLYGLLAFSILAVAPGFHFRPHYWALLLPAAALFGAALLVAVAELLSRRMRAGGVRIAMVLLLVGVSGATLYAQRAYLLLSTPVEACRMTYGPNPFPEAVEAGSYIRRRSSPDERILVLGSEPEIPFYAGRRSVTRQVYMYPLNGGSARARTLQDQVIQAAESAPPRYVVFVSVGASWVDTGWLGQSGPDRRLFRWFEDFRKHYRAEVLWEIGPHTTRRIEGEALRGHGPPARNHLLVLRRIDG